MRITRRSLAATLGIRLLSRWVRRPWDNDPMNPAAMIAGLKGIREPTIRRKVLAESLAQGDPALWVEALARVLARSVGETDVDARAAVDTLAHAVGEPSLDY